MQSVVIGYDQSNYHSCLLDVRYFPLDTNAAITNTGQFSSRIGIASNMGDWSQHHSDTHVSRYQSYSYNSYDRQREGEHIFQLCDLIKKYILI